MNDEILSHEDELLQENPHYVLNLILPEVSTIVHIFKEARLKGVKERALCWYISTNLRPEVTIPASAQNEMYLYNALKEVRVIGKVKCLPKNMPHNSTIVYRKMATIWPETHADLIGSFNVVRKNIRGSKLFSANHVPTVVLYDRISNSNFRIWNHWKKDDLNKPQRHHH